MAKRGAHAPPFLLSAPEGFQSFESAYGAHNLVDSEDWLMSADGQCGVRIVTGAPEIQGVMGALNELNKRGVVFSIGHRCASPLRIFCCFFSTMRYFRSVSQALTLRPLRLSKALGSSHISSTLCLNCIIVIRPLSDSWVLHRISPPPLRPRPSRPPSAHLPHRSCPASALKHSTTNPPELRIRAARGP